MAKDSPGSTDREDAAAEGVEDMFGIIDGTYFGCIARLATTGSNCTRRAMKPPRCTWPALTPGSPAGSVAMASNGPGVANVLPGVAVERAKATASCSSPLRGACPSRTPTGAARISTSTRSA